VARERLVGVLRHEGELPLELLEWLKDHPAEHLLPLGRGPARRHPHGRGERSSSSSRALVRRGGRGRGNPKHHLDLEEWRRRFFGLCCAAAGRPRDGIVRWRKCRNGGIDKGACSLRIGATWTAESGRRPRGAWRARGGGYFHRPVWLSACMRANHPNPNDFSFLILFLGGSGKKTIS
jgi:hypothetical protein